MGESSPRDPLLSRADIEISFGAVIETQSFKTLVYNALLLGTQF